MPPPASHHLALLVLPADPDRDPSGITELYAHWRGVSNLVEGGNGRVGLDVHERLRFLANRQGGFRVYCPLTGVNIVPAFNPAITRWRAGGDRVLDCACGAVHDLLTLRYEPAAGFAREWLTVYDVASSELTPAAAAFAEARCRGVRIVLRRG